MQSVVALTGASGFIGSQIARLLLTHGFNVRALSRSQSGVNGGIHWVRGSLEDARSLTELVAGARLVIHCAGAVRGRGPQSFHEVNAQGSARLIRAARESGSCERFLLMSSLAARYPDLSWYARSKFEAEQRVLGEAGDIRVGIFRPTAVYGPGDKELRPLFAWLLRGLLVRLGTDESCLSFVHVYDLAAAVLSWTTSYIPRSTLYEINDGALGGYSWNALARIGADIREGQVRQIAISASVLKCLARLNLALSYLTSQPPMLTSSKVNELVHPDWTCSNRTITEATGWEPRITLRRALHDGLF